MKRSTLGQITQDDWVGHTIATRAEIHLYRYIRHKEHRFPSPGEVEAWLSRDGVSEVLRLVIPDWLPPEMHYEGSVAGVREAIKADPKHAAGIAAVRAVRRGTETG